MRKLNRIFLVLIWPFRNEIIKQEIEFIKRGKIVFIYQNLYIVDKRNFKL